METHFIQRAGEINVHMPSYVVSKVPDLVDVCLNAASDRACLPAPGNLLMHRTNLSELLRQVTLALNDRCKAVNGARILIVGVAYKVSPPLPN